jgi:hypothetical protein
VLRLNDAACENKISNYSKCWTWIADSFLVSSCFAVCDWLILHLQICHRAGAFCNWSMLFAFYSWHGCTLIIPLFARFSAIVISSGFCFPSSAWHEWVQGLTPMHVYDHTRMRTQLNLYVLESKKKSMLAAFGIKKEYSIQNILGYISNLGFPQLCLILAASICFVLFFLYSYFRGITTWSFVVWLHTICVSLPLRHSLDFSITLCSVGGNKDTALCLR